MPCIVYQDEERAVLISKGSTILQASLENKIPHYSECGGKGTCNTCRVKILSGHENLMTRNSLELEIAKTRNWDKTIRLACQSRILGDIVIEKLVKTEEDSFNTYLEPYYLTPLVFKKLSFLVLKILNFEDILTKNPPLLAEQKLEKILTTIRNIGTLNGGYIAEFQPRFVLIVFGLLDGDFTSEQSAIRAALLIQKQLAKIQGNFREDSSIQNLSYGIGIHSCTLNIVSFKKYKSILLEGKGLQEINFFMKLFKKFPKSVLLSNETYNLIESLECKCKKYKVQNKDNQFKNFFILEENFSKDELYYIFLSHLEIINRKTEFLNEIFQTVFQKKPYLEEKISSDRERLKIQLFHLFNQVVFGLTRYSKIVDMLEELGKRLKLKGFHESEIVDLKEILFQTISKFFPSGSDEDISSAWKNFLEKAWTVILNGYHEDSKGV